MLYQKILKDENFDLYLSNLDDDELDDVVHLSENIDVMALCCFWIFIGLSGAGLFEFIDVTHILPLVIISVVWGAIYLWNLKQVILARREAFQRSTTILSDFRSQMKTEV